LEFGICSSNFHVKLNKNILERASKKHKPSFYSLRIAALEQTHLLMEINFFKQISEQSQQTSQKFCTWREKRRKRGRGNQANVKIYLCLCAPLQKCCRVSSACVRFGVFSSSITKRVYARIPVYSRGAEWEHFAGIFISFFFCTGCAECRKNVFLLPQRRKCRLGIRIEAAAPLAGSLIHPHSCRQLQ
jgi:hypothetical protein